MTFVNMERIEKRFNNQTVLRELFLLSDLLVLVNPRFCAA